MKNNDTIDHFTLTSTFNAEQALLEAVELHRAGSLQAAEQRYQAILQVHPYHPDANHNLGVLATQVNRTDVALVYFKAARDNCPDRTLFWLSYLETLIQAGDTAAAHQLLAESKGLHDEAFVAMSARLNAHHHTAPLPPESPGQQELYALALLFNEGKYTEAAPLAKAMTQEFPLHDFAWKILGAILNKNGLLNDALAAMQHAAALSPNDIETHINLGNQLKELGMLAEAANSYQHVLELNPELPGIHNNLGNTLRALGRVDDAVASYRRALAIKRDFTEAHYNMGVALQDLGQLDQAVASYQEALSNKPDFAEAHSNMGSALKDLGRLDEAVASCKRALEINSDLTLSYSNLLFIHNYRSDLSAELLLTEAKRFGELVARLAHPYTDWTNDPNPERCLRLGIVSGDLCNHPVGYFFEGVLAALANDNSEQIKFFIYSNSLQCDQVTERIKVYCQEWHGVAQLTDHDLARQIHSDQIDILIDLSGHTAHNRLPMFAWKPAPIQVSWLGYFATTGVQAIDYLIADPWTVPENEEAHFSETIWRLPETRLCFTPPDVDIKVAQLPALTQGYITFGCFNNLSKMSDDVVALWAQVLHAVRGSRLFLKTKQLSVVALRESVIRRFAAQGINADRLILEGPSSRSDYLAAYHRVDIALDPFPYPGGTTSVEGLWMGVPVLTLASERFLPRQGVGLLMNAGLSEWIAADEEDYVALATLHARDLQYLAELRKKLRPQVLASPIFDAPRFAGHFNHALRGMWQKWCAQQHRVSAQLASIATPLQQEIDLLASLFNNGNHTQAEALARAMTEQFPLYGFGWKVLGAVLKKLGHTDNALVAMQEAVKLSPEDVESHYNLGTLLHELGQLDAAIASYRFALKLQPDFAEAYNNLGNALNYLGQIEEAVNCYRQAVTIKPDYADAHNNLGTALQDLGQFEDALASYQHALSNTPGFAEAHSNRGAALKDLGRLEEAVKSCRLALELKPDLISSHSNLLFIHNYLMDEPADLLLAEARRFGELVAQQARPFTDWQIDPDANRCLNVGMVSGDFRNHPVGYFIESILAALASKASGKLNLIAYSNNFHTDPVTQRIKACCHEWHSIAGFTDESLASKIHNDHIDILIDLSGHTAYNRLTMFAWKPAPVQVTWLGYFATTGISAIDYLIADPWTVPENEETHFTEKIWRLPETRLCFTPPDIDVQVSALPALSKGHVTFGCFNNLSKMSDDVIKLWSQILLAIPDSNLFLKAMQLREPAIRQSVLHRFAAHGIKSDRLILEGPSSRADYLTAYHQVDIALDPFPFPGGTTSVEGLWMGVPVISLTGDRFLSRQGTGLLMNAGLSAWIANSKEDYVSRAVSHAGDLPGLAKLRRELRRQILTSPIFNAVHFATNFETALRGMWQKWCNDKNKL